MKSNQKETFAKKIYNKLLKLYPEATCSLRHRDPWQLLVATILSAQCTDKQVNKVTKKLFKKYKNAEEMARADIEDIKNIIRPTGFYNNKAKSIQGASQYIIEQNKHKVPDTMEELLKLPGVGRKTANVVLGDGFGTPGVVVDTHVKRISNRLGLTENTNPEKIEQDLMQILPKESWTPFGHLIIAHGRRLCKARNPLCQDCFLLHDCPSSDKFLDN
ncbi:MAG: endonuclease III [Candidatus Marinimicrobia bacterium]|nr:endonuclease III [Candidatus Neomarinimicrobiota bacterium]